MAVYWECVIDQFCFGIPVVPSWVKRIPNSTKRRAEVVRLTSENTVRTMLRSEPVYFFNSRCDMRREHWFFLIRRYYSVYTLFSFCRIYSWRQMLLTFSRICFRCVFFCKPWTVWWLQGFGSFKLSHLILIYWSPQSIYRSQLHSHITCIQSQFWISCMTYCTPYRCWRCVCVWPWSLFDLCAFVSIKVNWTECHFNIVYCGKNLHTQTPVVWVWFVIHFWWTKNLLIQVR